MFLSYDDLVEMTGFRSVAKMRDWLAINGYEFDIRADGRPNVLVRQVVDRQCKGASSRAPAMPDLDALDKFY